MALRHSVHRMLRGVTLSENDQSLERKKLAITFTLFYFHLL